MHHDVYENHDRETVVVDLLNGGYTKSNVYTSSLMGLVQ